MAKFSIHVLFNLCAQLAIISAECSVLVLCMSGLDHISSLPEVPTLPRDFPSSRVSPHRLSHFWNALSGPSVNHLAPVLQLLRYGSCASSHSQAPAKAPLGSTLTHKDSLNSLGMFHASAERSQLTLICSQAMWRCETLPTPATTTLTPTTTTLTPATAVLTLADACRLLPDLIIIVLLLYRRIKACTILFSTLGWLYWILDCLVCPISYSLISVSHYSQSPYLLCFILPITNWNPLSELCRLGTSLPD
jgi:hypothetical protein